MPTGTILPGEIGRLDTASSVSGTADYIPILRASGEVEKVTPDTLAAGQDAVIGPASSTDNAIVRFDGTTGELVQNSVVTIADSTGDITGVGALTMAGALAGVTTLGMSGALSGGTTISISGAITASGAILTAFNASTSSGTIGNNGITTIASTAPLTLALTAPALGVFKWIRSGATATTVHLVHTTGATLGVTTAATLSFAGIDDYVILRGESTSKWGIYSKSTGVTST